MKYQYVVHDPNGGWNVKREGSAKATKHFKNKEDAKAFAKAIAKSQHTGIRVQKLNGTFSEEDTYGKDPFPPKG